MSYSPKYKFNKSNASTIEQLREDLNRLGVGLNHEHTQISRTIQTSQNVTINNIIRSGASGTTTITGSGVTTVSKSVVGGTSYVEVFLQPSKLLGVPISYGTTSDGLPTQEVLPLLASDVNGFTVQPIQNGTLIYSYQEL